MTMLSVPPDDAIEQLTSVLNAANATTLWTTILVNAVLPPMQPQPDWYDTIDATIGKAQTQATTWITTTAPTIFAGLTQSLISYADTFSTSVGYVTSTIAAIKQAGASPTAAQIEDLKEIIGALQSTTCANIATIRSMLDEISAYRDVMASQRSALDAAIKAALPEEQADRAAVQQIQTQIQSIDLTLAADSASASSSDLDNESAISSLVIGLTFAAEFDPVGFGMGLIAIGVNAVLDAADHARVISDLDQIRALTATLSADQIQLGMIQAVVSNLERLSAGVGDSLAAYEGFDDTWTLADLSLQYLLIVLAQPQVDISTIPDLDAANLVQATDDWNRMADFARKVLSSQLSPQPSITISAASRSSVAAA